MNDTKNSLTAKMNFRVSGIQVGRCKQEDSPHYGWVVTTHDGIPTKRTTYVGRKKVTEELSAPPEYVPQTVPFEDRTADLNVPFSAVIFKLSNSEILKRELNRGRGNEIVKRLLNADIQPRNLKEFIDKVESNPLSLKGHCSEENFASLEKKYQESLPSDPATERHHQEHSDTTAPKFRVIEVIPHP